MIDDKFFKQAVLAAMQGRIATTDFEAERALEENEYDPSLTRPIAAWSINMARELCKQMAYMYVMKKEGSDY